MVSNAAMLRICLRSWQFQIASRISRVWLDDEAGQDMVEYALLAGVISVAGVAVALLIGPYLDSMFLSVIHAWQST